MQKRLAHYFRLCTERISLVRLRQRQRQKRRGKRDIFRRLAAEIKGVRQRTIGTEPRDLDFRFRVIRESRRNLMLRVRHFAARKYEQRPRKVDVRALLVQYARQFHRNLFQIAEAVNRLREIVDAQAARLHRRPRRLGKRIEIKIEGFVRQRHGFCGHGLMVEIIVLRIEMQITECERRRVQKIHRDGRTRRLPETKFHVHIRTETELLQNGFVRGLSGKMGAHQVMRHERAERLRNQSRRAGVESVEHDEPSMRRRTEDNPRNTADFEPADFGKQIDSVRGIRPIRFQCLPHDFDFHFQAFVGNIRAASCGLLRRKAAG